jgi:ribosome-associated protein
MGNKKKTSRVSGRDKALLIARTALQKKPLDPVLLQVEGLCSFTDFFLVLSGTSTRQTQALAEHLRTALAKEGLRPLGMEGEETGQWILMDYDEVVVHIFLESVRGFYDLEGLWLEAERLPLPEEKIRQDEQPEEA